MNGRNQSFCLVWRKFSQLEAVYNINVTQVAAIGERMEEEEERLAERARELRRFFLLLISKDFTQQLLRKSTGVFQFVTDNRAMITKAENARSLPQIT